MNYFTELLESFEKLKKRKLKLLESVDPEQWAQSELQKAQQQNPPPSTAVPYITMGVRKKVAIFNSAKGWKFSPVNNDGSVNVGQSKFLDRFYQQFVGMFREDDDGKQQTANDSKPKVKLGGGELLQQTDMFEMHGEELNPAIEAFQDIAIIANNVYTNLPAKLVKGKNWGSPALFSNYLYGARKQSLESLTINVKTKINYDEDTNTYVTTVEPPNAGVVSEVSKKIKLIVESLAKDNITDSATLHKLESSFAINSDGSVSIFSDTIDSGLVYKDDNGFLKMLISALNIKFKVKVRKIDLSKQVSTGLDNVTRGVALEEVLTLFSMEKKIQEMTAVNHPGVKILQKELKANFFEIKQKLKVMKQTYQSWVKAYNESALEPEDVKIINTFAALLGDGSEKLIASMVKVSKDAIAVRKPDFILTKGRETGEGRRQDTFEIHSDFNKAKTGLLKMGYTDEEISLKGMIKEAPIEEVFKGRENKLAAVIGSGLFLKGQKVFYTPVSLKNYIGLDEAVFGSTTVGSNKNFMDGVSNDPNNLFLKKYADTTGMSKEIHAGVMKYSESLHTLGGDIRKLEAKVKARSGTTGKVVNSSPFRSFVENTLDLLKSNSSYRDLYDAENPDSTLYNLSLLLDKYKSSDEDDTDLENKIKQYTATWLKNRKLAHDIEKGDKNAIHYLAMKLFNSGGCVDDGLMCDYRGLATGERYSFNQNDVIKEVLQSFVNGDGKWKMSSNGNNFHFTETSNPRIKLSLIDKVEKKTLSNNIEFSTKTLCLVNKHLMLKFNKRNISNESVISNLIQYQRLLLSESLSKEELIW